MKYRAFAAYAIVFATPTHHFSASQ
jgi:hypothetical protein